MGKESSLIFMNLPEVVIFSTVMIVLMLGIFLLEHIVISNQA